MTAAVLSLAASAPTAHAVGTGNVLLRWAVTQAGPQAVTHDQAVAEARNYDVLIARKEGAFTPFLADMRAANPTLKILVYLNGAYAQSSQGPSSHVYDTSWYATSSGGQYITTKSGQTDSEGNTGNWLMDVSNAGWVQDRVQTCTNWMAQTSYDGCYVDMLGNPSVSTSYVTAVPVHQNTTANWNAGDQWTAPQWLDATSSLGAAVKTGNSGHMVVGNGLENGRQYFLADQGPTSKLLTQAPLAGLDGGNAQGWIRGASEAIDSFPGGGSNGDRDWKRDVNLVVSAGLKGRSAMTMTKVWNVTPSPTQAQIDAVHRFALASFLLGTDGNQYFLFDTDPNDGAVAADHAYDHVNVGTPTESSPCSGSDTTCTQDASGAYARHFTTGVAVVNPTNATVTYSLGAPMTDLEGQTVSQVTLAPDTGDVFTTEFASVSLNPSSIPPNGTSTSTATATLTDGHGNRVPGRPVTFSTSGDATIGSVTDHGDGTYTATITASTTPGDQTITAHDGSLASSATLHQTWPTTTSLTSSKATTTYGSSVTFTATVGSPGGGVPTGTASFYDGGSPLGTADVNSSGQAQLSTGALTAGTHSITVTYSGDATHQLSTSAPLSETVSKAATTTGLNSSPSPSSYGSSVSLVATVTSAGGLPTGTVTFKDGSNVIGSAAVDGTGHAQMSTSSLAVGSHTLGAAYGGDGNFNTSSGTHSQTVTKAGTSTALTSSANPASYGSPVTFTATVTSGGGTPTGTVTFKNGSTSLGTATLDGTGNASLTKTLTKVSNSITAVYAGSTNFAGSTSPVYSQSQSNAPATVALTTSSASVTAPTSVTFTASVTSSAGTPTGTVTFYDGSTALGSPVNVVSGKAKLTWQLPPGGHVITAAYSGDSSFAPKTSGALFQKVNRTGAKSSSTAVSMSPSPATSGQSVAITATVTGVGATGTVWFFDGSNMIGSATVDGSGHAVFTTSALSVGSHSIKAGYSGDSTFNPSLSNAKTQTVNP